MADLSPKQKAARLAELRRLLAARQSVPGYRTNVDAIKAEIAELSNGAS